MKIIDGKQSKFKQIIEFIFTFLAWALFLFLLSNLIPSVSHFYVFMNTESFLNFALIVTSISLIIVASSTLSWGFYNKRKYGSLNRRTMPVDVNIEELSEAYNLSIKEVEKFQNEKWVDVEILKAHVITKQDILRALKSDEFFLVYQPEYNMKTGTISGIEAFIRWDHPERGILYPQSFLPIAEETDLILSIDEWVLQTACEQWVKWNTVGIPAIVVKVNISVKQFKQLNVCSLVERILHQTKIKPSFLELEVSEGVMIQNDVKVLDSFKTLKKLGIKLALDDFGIGVSSLGYLKDFPIDHLKIDRSLVSDIFYNYTSKAIIQTIINLAHGFKIEVIAEGVEDEAQLDFLMNQECDKVQGNLLSRSLTIGEIEEIFYAHQQVASTSEKEKNIFLANQIRYLIAQSSRPS